MCLQPPTGRVYISRNVLFSEQQFSYEDVYSEFQTKATTPLLPGCHTNVLQESTVHDVPIGSEASQQQNKDVSEERLDYAPAIQ